MTNPRRRSIVPQLLAAGLLAVAATFAGCGRPTEDAPALVVALKPDKDPDRMLAEREALASFLAGRLGRPVEVVVPLSAAVIQEGLANGTIDAAYLSATDLVRAMRADSARLLLAGEIAGRTTYRSLWVVRADSPLRSIADLRGRRVAFASRTSTSGYVVPLDALHRDGMLADGQSPEAFFGAGNVLFGSGYVSAIERVLAGDAEAAAVSAYVLEEDRHLDAAQRAALRELASPGPVPTHVLAVRTGLADADAVALRAALTDGLDDDGRRLVDRLFTGRLVEVDAEAHVGGLRTALARVEQAP